MKVLFAVSNESISKAIIKKYQQMYKEIIINKNVYYFNAIIKELQKDKTYDRVVISEDLEPFANSNYEAIDNFIFEKLDEISDEATTSSGEDIPIILITSDRRTKSERLLVRLFGIGIYSAVIGQDRSIEELCRLIQKPRSKKQAKVYYRIDANSVSYKPENEEDVSEVEIQNILSYFKRLGKDEERYVQSFESLASQYTEQQLKVIIKFLPVKVKKVLEEKSETYVKIMSFGLPQTKMINEFQVPNKGKKRRSENESSGITVTSIPSGENSKPTKPVIIPTANKTKKVENDESKNAKEKIESMPINQVPRRRGRPRKIEPQLEEKDIKMEETKKGKGRPRKIEEEKHLNDNEDNGFEDFNEPDENEFFKFDEIDDKVVNAKDRKTKEKEQKDNFFDTDEDEVFPGFDDEEDEELPQYDEEENEELPEYDEEENKELPQYEEEDEKELPEYDEEENEELPKYEKEDEEELPEYDEEENEELPKYEDEEDEELTGFDEEENEELPQYEEDDDEELPGFDEEENEELPQYDDEKDEQLPGFDEEENEELPQYDDEKDEELPGFDEEENEELPQYDDEENGNFFDYEEEGEKLPGFDDNEEETPSQFQENSQNENLTHNNTHLEKEHNVASTITNKSVKDFFAEDDDKKPYTQNNGNTNYSYDLYSDSMEMQDYQNQPSAIEGLISGNQKVVAFVGTSKNGTSFLVNNIAEIVSNRGIKTAILDLTKNKNSYYIYTKNEEELRKNAYECMEKLTQGIAQGVKVNSNLDVYTSIPGEAHNDDQYRPILETLVQNYSLILLDCDFKTNYAYLKEAQEIYITQSMDVLTIQPLTAYLRDLKAKGVLNQDKLRVVINKYIKVRGINEKAVLGGMAFYNDPSMAYMTELFNRETIPYCTIPFDSHVYAKYLESLVNCNISTNSYTKDFLNSLKKLADMVFPLIGTSEKGKERYNNPKYNKFANSGTFSKEMNSTLNKMRGKY